MTHSFEQCVACEVCMFKQALTLEDSDFYPPRRTGCINDAMILKNAKMEQPVGKCIIP